MTCLGSLAESRDPSVRLGLATDPAATAEVLSTLAADDDAGVRLVIAGRPDTPLVDLQRLEHDGDPRVRAVAGDTLSAALTPRAFDDADRGSLFTPAELDALGSADSTGGEPQWSHAPNGIRLRTIPGGSEGRPRHLARGPSSGVGIEDLEDVISRLESLGERLSSLEAALTSTGEQLSKVTRLLGDLSGDPPPEPTAVSLAVSKRLHSPWATPTRPERGAAGR